MNEPHRPNNISSQITNIYQMTATFGDINQILSLIVFNINNKIRNGPILY